MTRTETTLQRSIGMKSRPSACRTQTDLVLGLLVLEWEFHYAHGHLRDRRRHAFLLSRRLGQGTDIMAMFMGFSVYVLH
jgi:hypothetical protein